jgi:exosome complex RNA-binding protein Csl4
MIEPGDPAIRSIVFVDEEPEAAIVSGLVDEDPGVVVLTCANCGAAMDERKCKLICRCGYFLSCSDYY